MIHLRKETRLRNLSAEDKYQILVQNNPPATGKVTRFGPAKRWFKKEIISKTENGRFTHYSQSEDKVFCLACAFFAPPDSKYYPELFAVTGFQNWKKFGNKTEKGGLKSHCEQEIHMSSFLKTVNFMKIMAGNANEAPIKMNAERKKKIEKNNAILDANIDIMKYVASQGLASRGHSKTIDPADPHKNRGNFVALQELVGKFNPVMQEAIDKVKASHEAKTRIQASMMSKQIFEELIEITGKKVSSSVFEDVRKSGMYVIIADEVTVFNQSYLSLCLRYVHHTEKEVREDFVTYELLESGKAETIFNVLVEELEVGGLNLGKEKK